MARREALIGEGGGGVAEFALELRALRQDSGQLTYRDMAAKAHYSAPALSRAANGQRLPTWDCVKAYLYACDVTDPVEVHRWRQRWDAVRQDATKTPGTRDETDHSVFRTVAEEPLATGRTACEPDELAVGTPCPPGRSVPPSRTGSERYRLDRRAQGSGPPSSRGRFVGRRAELAVLEQRLTQAASGTAGVVLVGDEAGVGMNRLVREFAARAEASGACVLTGSCTSPGAGEAPYAPLIEALRRLIRERGEAELTGPAYPQLANLVSDSAGVELAQPMSQQWVPGAVLRLLDRLGADAPAVLLIEDLHWAGPSTLDLVSYLARARTSERFLLVCTYRSTNLSPQAPLRALLAELNGARQISWVQLHRFTLEELRKFLDSVNHELTGR